MISPTRVFISYSHDSPEHVEAVLSLADRLRNEGVDAFLDQYEEAPSEGWPRWMLNQLDQAQFVLVVCTEAYYQRFRGKEQPHRGLGANWEGAIITQELYDEALNNEKFIPVVLDEAYKTSIPEMLKAFTLYNLASAEGYENLYRRLTSQPKIPVPQIGTLRPLPPQKRKQVFKPSPKDVMQTPSTKINDSPFLHASTPRWISKSLLDAMMIYARNHKGAVVLSILTIVPFVFVLELLMFSFMLEGAIRPLWLSIKAHNQVWIHKLGWTGGLALIADIISGTINTPNGWVNSLFVIMNLPFIICLVQYYTSNIFFELSNQI